MNPKWLLRTSSFVLANSLSIWCLTGLYGAWFATRNTNRKIEEVSEIGGLPVEEISTETSDNITLSGWLVRPEKAEKAVLLVSGRGCNRGFNVSRADWYVRRGYAVLLLDLRGTGRSGGYWMSFGWRERKDVLAGYLFLRNLGFEKVIGHGHSQGAAAIVYALREIPNFHFLVLESCYYSISTLQRNIMEMCYLPNYWGGGVRFFSEKMLGMKLDKMRPNKFLEKYCTVPTFFMAGDKEFLVSEAETYALFEHCGTAAEDKILYFFKGLRHKNFCKVRPEEYKKVLSSFVTLIETKELAAKMAEKEAVVTTKSRFNWWSYINPYNFFDPQNSVA